MPNRRLLIASILALALPLLLARAGYAMTGFYVDADAEPGGEGSLESPWDDPNDLEDHAAEITTAAASGPVVVYLDRQDSWNIEVNNWLALASHGTSWTNGVTYDGMSWTGDAEATDQTRACIVLNVNVNGIPEEEIDYNRGVWVQNGVAYNSGNETTYDAYVKVYGLDISGNNLTFSTAPLQTFNANHVIVENCHLHDAGNINSPSDGIRFITHEVGTHGLTITDLQVKDCILDTIAAHGIAFYPTNTDNVGDILVEGCTISNFGINYLPAAGIQVMSADSGLVRGNTIHGSHAPESGSGIKLECRHSQPTDVLIEGNTVFGLPGEETHHGIELAGAVDATLRNNRLFDLSGCGIFIHYSMEDFGSQPSLGVNINDNTISNTADHAIGNCESACVIASLTGNIMRMTTNTSAIYNIGTILSHGYNILYHPNAKFTAVWDNGVMASYRNIKNWESTARYTCLGALQVQPMLLLLE